MSPFSKGRNKSVIRLILFAPVRFHDLGTTHFLKEINTKDGVKLNFGKVPCFEACDAQYEKLPKLLPEGKIRNKEREGFCPDLPNIINWEKD